MAAYKIKHSYNGTPTIPKENVEAIKNTFTKEMVKLGYAPSSQVTSPITVTSYPRNQSMPESYNLRKSPDGQIMLGHSTANNPKTFQITKEDYERHGHFSAQIDDTNSGRRTYQGWLDACQKKGTGDFSVIEPQRHYKIVTEIGDTPSGFHPKDTYLTKRVKEMHYEGRMNYVGKAVSTADNVEASLKAHLRERIPQEVLSDLREQGHKPKEIKYVGVNVGPEGIIYAVGKAKNGKTILIAADDTGAKILQLAHYLGVDPELMKTYARNEELAHIWMDSIERREKGVPLIAEERRTKSELAKIYRNRIERSGGNRKLQKNYGDLARIAEEWDLPTIRERYKGEGLFTKGLENIVNDSRVEVVAGENGEVYTTVDGKRVVGGDGAYTPSGFIGSGSYGDKPSESGTSKINSQDIKSMSDVRETLASKAEAKDSPPEAAEQASSES